jgi:integrase/recombinase XerD
MAQILKRKGSPFWYARFEHGGKAYLISTKTTSRRKALKALEEKRSELAGERSSEDAARSVLRTFGITQAPKASALRRLTGELIAQADPDEVAAAFVDRIRAVAEDAAKNPSALAQLTEDRRRWARAILGAQGTAVALDGAWDAWLNAPRRSIAHEATMNGSYGPIWDRFCAWAAARGMKHLHDLTPADASAYLSHLQKEDLSANTIRKHRGFLITLWNALKLQAGLTDNPWAALPAPDATPSIRRALSMDEIKRLFAAATDPEDQTALALGLFAALRLGDAANLPWTAVRLDEGLLVLHPQKTKRYGREVRIPIHPALRAALTARRTAAPSDAWVCPRLHALYTEARSRAGHRITELFTAAGIPLVGEKTDRRRRAPSLGAFHALRHSFISFAARAGVPQLAVRAIVGHSNAATTRLYEHVDEPTLQKAVDAIPSMDSLPGGTEPRSF